MRAVSPERRRPSCGFAFVVLIAATVLHGCSGDQGLPVHPRHTVVPDLVYASYEDRELRLDLFLPDTPIAVPTPVVIAIRGGGFRRGDKAAFGPMAAALAERGIAAASIEYRTSSEALFPGAIEDCKAAVRWVRANADAYGLDRDAIGLFGASAGGYLAAFVGATADVGSLEGAGGSPGASSAVQSVVALAPESGPTDRSWWAEFLNDEGAPDTETRAFASVLNQLDEEAEPDLLLIHSRQDTVVPISHSRALLEGYRSTGNSAALMEISLAPHAFWYSPLWFLLAMDAAADHFAQTLIVSP
ncbi:alpha/beta hydrolase [uncultured Abyssibacter sp.]|uniref:alpha/beta hydrolase n=1 Tax=uncultured Abyssibacter sp. TaxID=2320202 RepID=UPI0032B139F0